MSSSKHPGPGKARPFRNDLLDDPGIGSSKGTTMTGEDPHILRDEGTNTEEGDVENDTDATGAITPMERHRTNK